MIQKIRKSKSFKAICFLLSFNIFSTGIGWNNFLFAGDGGPTQPEVQSFEPISTNQMVDLFTGDFTYNIPLFNLPGPDGGYPINLAYHSGVSMEQEASWVGLGWNINMGTINRQVRNLPDDFDGSSNVEVKKDMRPDWTVGVGYKVALNLWGFDALGNQTSPVAGSFNMGIKLFYNNYKGIGYSMDAGLNLSMGKKKGSIFGDLGFNFSLNSQEGINSQFSLGIHGKNNDGLSGSANVSTGFNSRTGWQKDINISGSITKSIKKPITDQQRKELFQLFLNGGIDMDTYFSVSKEGMDKTTQRQSGGTTINFSQPIVSLNIPNAMRGGNGSLSLTTGAGAFGANAEGTSSIYFSFSTLKNKNKPINYSGIGYLNSENLNSSNDRVLKDYTTEKEGVVHKKTRRLAVPTLSYDIYSVTGQGIGNMFRPFRNDNVILSPTNITTKYNGGSFLFEKPGTAPDTYTGLDFGYNYSGTAIKNWSDNNSSIGYDVSSVAISQDSRIKKYYFQNYGEQSEDDLAANYGPIIAAERPTAYGLKADNNFYDITDIDQHPASNGSEIKLKKGRTSIKKRAKVIESFTNEMIINQQDQTISIPEFNIKYYTSTTGYNSTDVNTFKEYKTIRNSYNKNHIGGYTALNEQGMRYNYGIPAMNNEDVNLSFSVGEKMETLNETVIGPSSALKDGNEFDYKHSGSNNYFNQVKKSSYAHSYLLTSIFGGDYIDADDTPGASDGDLGYWVRFDYVRAHSNFKWRAPYSGVAYNKGYETSFKDGTGNVNYGNKEIWYVATVQTKTHIAEFILDATEREDAAEAGGKFDDESQQNKYKRLQKINIYAKSERYPNGVFNPNAKPIQTVHFVYDYSLCTGTPDNLSGGGKLTLKKVYFTYRNNATGSTRPYTFEYNKTIDNVDISYNRNKVNRWGDYQPGKGSSTQAYTNIDYPYVDPYLSKTEMDKRAALWNLKAINLPSGGRYEVDYESDSYAYVQNQVAMQMFQITSLDSYGEGISENINHPENATGENRRVYFKLEEPISVSANASEQAALMNRYIQPNEYLYFKVKINMTKSQDSKQEVAGYAKVASHGVDLSSAQNGYYQWGYIELAKMKMNGKDTKFHPFTEAGARHLKYNQMDLLYDNPPNADKEKLAKSDVKNMGWSLLSIATDIKDIFMDFTNMVYSNDRCKYIDLNSSYLRLRTPDKEKFGGGHRVKEIRVIDNWAQSFANGELGAENSQTYATVYDYTIYDEKLKKNITSGVASYEPMIGADENPFRKPVAGWEDKMIASKSMATTYSEDPYNESLFPAATVGYRQVKEMTKVTQLKLNDPQNGPKHYTGVTVHHFHTSYDYPTITAQTELEVDKTFRKSKLIVPAILVNVFRERVAATQGYYIELNDMHGRPKGSVQLGYNHAGEEEEISKVDYEYYDESRIVKNDAGETIEIRELKNEVPVLKSDLRTDGNYTSADFSTKTLATELEFIPETKYFTSKQITAGLELNIDFSVTPPYLAMIPVPRFNWDEVKSGTVVTNKIINKTAIIKSVTAEKKGSIIKTENLIFDELTGAPILTSYNNEYGDKQFSYSILARDKYEGIGAAYKNIMLSSNVTVLANSYNPSNLLGIQEIQSNANDNGIYFEGDVVLATPIQTDPNNSNNFITDPTRSKQVVIVSETNSSTNKIYVETKTALANGLYKFTVIRAGRRNMLSAPVTTILASQDPTINRTERTILGCGSRVESYKTYSIDKVIAINAVEMSHTWMKDYRQTPQGLFTGYGRDMLYSMGYKGIWSPIRSYYYLDERIQSNPVNLKTDGVFNDVTLLNYNYLTRSTFCIPEWRLANQVNLKNLSSVAIEEQNALGIKSSSLYGKYGIEPIAMAANASNYEIGVENFEEYPTGSLVTSKIATNNLNFYTSNDLSTIKVRDRIEIINGGLSNGELLTNHSIANLSNTSLFSNYAIKISADYSTLNSKNEYLHYFTPNFSFVNNKVYVGLGTNPSLNLGDWRGELFVDKTIQATWLNANNSCVSIANAGHTGKKSMLLTGNGSTAKPEFFQTKIALTPGKDYEFSGWFKNGNFANQKSTLTSYLNGTFEVKFYDITGTEVAGSALNFTETDALSGKLIEDWQKFKVQFKAPANAHYVKLILPHAPAYLSQSLTYYDDLRVQPLDGGMQTYVYNQENQRLEAVLDGNNYATFYYYDDEGNLFLVKKETENGIITQQESRTYIKKQP